MSNTLLSLARDKHLRNTQLELSFKFFCEEMDQFYYKRKRMYANWSLWL